MQIIYNICIIYKQIKSKVLPYGLYTLLLVFEEPWVDIFMNFILHQKIIK